MRTSGIKVGRCAKTLRAEMRRPAAPSATATAASTTPAASTTALGKRDICSAKWRAKRKPERAETWHS
jgi:hypothetical protein